jgi:hypothetical protein
MTPLPALIARLTARISANEAAMGRLDRVDRIRLVPVTDRLRRYRDAAQVGLDQPHRRIEMETLLGPNMRGPKIDDLCRQSEAICAGALKVAA